MQIKSFKVFLKDNEDKRLKTLLDKIPASHKSILKDVSVEEYRELGLGFRDIRLY